MRMPTHVKKIFWDVNPKEIDAKKHKHFLITRIAEKGSWSDVLWLKNQYSKDEIKYAVAHSKNVSAKTKAFWNVQ